MAKKVVRDFEVTRAREYNGKKNHCIFFGLKLEVEGIDIFFNDLTIMEGKKGEFIAYPNRPYEKDGETKYASYYNLMLNDAEVKDIIKMVHDQLEEEE